MTVPAPRDPSGSSPSGSTPSGSTARIYRVCLVCLGNICRSPLAEVVLRERLDKAGLGDAVVVDSAGTGDWHLGEDMDRRSRRVLEDAGYQPATGVGRHRARQVQPDWFDRRDLVLGMDRQNLSSLRRIAPEPAIEQGRLELFGSYGEVGVIPDPYSGGTDGFVHVLTLVERAADQLTAELGRQLSGGAARRGT